MPDRCYHCKMKVNYHPKEGDYVPIRKIHKIPMCEDCYYVAIEHCAHLREFPRPGLFSSGPPELTPRLLRLERRIVLPCHGRRRHQLAAVALLLGTTYTNLLRALRLQRSIQRLSQDLRLLTVPCQPDKQWLTARPLSIPIMKKASAQPQSAPRSRPTRTPRLSTSRSPRSRSTVPRKRSCSSGPIPAQVSGNTSRLATGKSFSAKA